MATKERAMPCRKGFTTLAFGWMQTLPNQFERYFIRGCSDCNKMHIDKLSWVDTEFVWCLSCFSQKVELDPGLPIHYRCTECGHATEFELEPDDAED